MEERMKIINNIIEITNDNKEHVDIQDIKLEFTSKNSIYHVILNGVQLTKRNKYYIKYKCLTCYTLHIVGTTQFLRKVNKCSNRCYLCCNKDENKHEVKHKSLIDLKEESINLFHTYDDDFKDNYFKNHLTEDDYKRLSKNLKSLQNGKHIIDDNLEYWPIFQTNNQTLFSSVFYDKINDMIVRAHQPIMQCDNCNQIWRAKTIEKFKNCYKILCQDCTFCNKTFKIRSTKNNVNEPILYQSHLELKFINWCKNNNITVVNGPTIVYEFEGKEKTYKVDFRIGATLIEIKDNYIWHKRQIESGVWKAKEHAVHNEIKKGLYKEYHIITSRNWMLELKSLLNKI
jgi:hypothetical protein